MERGKSSMTLNEAAAKIQVLSALVSRAQLSSSLGLQSYGGDRNIYEALGYKDSLLFTDYAARYLRQDIAKAIIDRPANATWQGPLLLQESKEAEETPLEKEWKILDNRLKLKTKFNRIDKLSGIGCYGVLLLGLDDVKSVEDFAKPVTVGTRKLLYVKPFGEGSAQINAYEIDTKNPRYGLPLNYKITIVDTAVGSAGTPVSTVTSSQNVIVHYTRIIHIIDDVLENEVIGLPKLQVVFNRLMDLEKIVGGDAEMFWRGARPGFQGKVDKDFQLTADMKQDLKEQVDEYEHNLRRMLVNEGVSYEALAQQIADPTNHVDVQLQMISAVTGIPKRILTGTERGELSSAQDASEWRSYVTGRRLDHAEPHIVRPFIDRCIELGVLPKPSSEDYLVVWSDLYSMSEADLVKIGMDRSTALKNYVSSPMSETVISPEGFLEYFLGLDENQIEVLKQKSLSEVEKEQISIRLNPPVAAPANPAKPVPSKKPMMRVR